MICSKLYTRPTRSCRDVLFPNEWFNPLWKSDRAKFVEQHTWPQMKELINTYQPDVFWTDGDWDAPAETRKSQNS